MPETPLSSIKKIKVLACTTVIEELEPLLPDFVDVEMLDFGLHLVPKNLKQSLQDAINEAGKTYDTVILGYGLCSMAVVGLKATNCTLVVPKVDDCIVLFLGSGEAYSRQVKKEPGTYYLTKGWLEVSDTLWDEYKRTEERYGEEKAKQIMKIMLKNYKRLVYIDTGVKNQDSHRKEAQRIAERVSLRFEEVQGSNKLVKKIIQGPWDDDILVVPPGEEIKYTDFK